MRRMTALRLAFSLLICALTCLPTKSLAQDLANKQALLEKARQSYYNLRTEGLSTFQCDVIPNWELLLKDQRKADPASADKAIATLNQLSFTTVLGSDDSVKVSHKDLADQSKQMMDALAQVISGMEQMTSGFFDTWDVFMLKPPFPEVKSEYHMEAVGSGYRLSYQEKPADGPADVVTSMDHDFAVSNMHVTTAKFDSTIRPTFTRTAKGLRLSGYDADYASQNAAETTHLKVFIDYQDVSGLSVPQKLNLSGSYGGSPFAVELTYTGCQVSRK